MPTIHALDRGLRVLLELCACGSAPLHALHRNSGIPKPTLLRILKTLESRGLVWRRIADGSYCASYRLTSRSKYVGQADRLVRAASPVLEALCADILWPSDVAVPRRDYMEICETNRSRAPIHLNRELIGLRVPMLYTAHGRAYLAFCSDEQRAAAVRRLRSSRLAGTEAARNPCWLERMIEQTRAQGYAARDPDYRGNPYRAQQKRDDGMQAIAVPVFHAGRVAGTLNMVWVRRVATPAQMALRYLDDLRNAAKAIERNFAEARNGDRPHFN